MDERGIMKRDNIEKKKKRRYVKDHKTEILKYLKQGKDISEIAVLTGFTGAAVYRFLQDAGYGMGKRHGNFDTRKGENGLTYAAGRGSSGETIKAGGKTYKDVTLRYTGW